MSSKRVIISSVLAAFLVLAGIFSTQLVRTDSNKAAGPISAGTQSVPDTTTMPDIASAATSINPGTEVMAWIYPGSPACDAPTEYADGREIDVLKAEYFTVNSEGDLIMLTTANSGCNAYSSANIANLKRHSLSQYATVSSASVDSIDAFLAHSLDDGASVNTLVNFVVVNDIEGIELDFEDFGSWTPETFESYKQFVQVLGDELHAKGKKLMIDGPAISQSSEQAWFVWRYEDFRTLPVDKIVVMAYDYQYDYGAGSPVAPIQWIKNVSAWTLTKFPHPDRLSIGIPSYGYRGMSGTQKIKLLTHAQITKEPGFSKAKRDVRSQEMTWKQGSNVYFYQDGESIRQKAKAAELSGIKSVSVWHLGGNRWITN